VAVVARALHHLDLHPADHHQVVLAVQVRPVVARRVDRQIDAMALAPTHVVDLHLPVQVLPVHLVRIVTVHLQVAAPQVVATHPIAAHTQVDHRLHVVIHRVQVRAQIPIAANAVTVHATRDQVQIVQQVVHTAIAILARLHVQVQIVHPVLTVTDQSVVMIVVHQVIAQQVVRMVIAIPVQVPVHLPIVVIVQLVVHTVTETPDHLRVQVPIDQRVVHTETEIHVRRHARVLIAQLVVHTETAIHVHHHVQVPIVHVAKIHTVAIAHAQAMTATPVHLRDTANAVAVQIVPEVVSPMIAKSVHAVALAKSA
jgi:hypothetical protein